MSKVCFHRNGNVSVDGVVVGTYHQPDPSGAPWARSLIWVLRTQDGESHQARTRSGLERHVLEAHHRAVRRCAPTTGTAA